MRRLVLAFGLILGCEDEAPPPPPPAVVVEAADTGAADKDVEGEEAEKPPRTAAEAAHDLLLGGSPDKAAAAAAALEDKALGARLVAAAVLAGAKAPAGSDALLEAEAKLLAGDAAGTMAAALSAVGEGTGDAAVLLARSIVAGAVLPEGTELPGPADALIKWATSADVRRARRHVSAAAAVKGWRADSFRAERAAAWGDKSGAAAAFDALAAGSDPRAKLMGMLGKLEQHHANSRSTVSAADVASWSAASHAIAITEGSLDQLNRATHLAVDAHKRSSDFSAALSVATQSKITAEAAGVDAAEASLAAADCALLVGDPAGALVITDAVRAANTDVTSDAHQRAAWTAGLAAWALGRTAELESASAAARGPNKDALKALVAMAKGDLETARLQFPPSGLDGQAAALIYGVAAQADAAGANQWHDRAIKGADAAGIPALSLSTRLAKESHLRTYDRRGASSLRREISQKLNLSPAVAGEIAVRSMLGGSPAAGSGATGPSAPIWSAMSQNAMPVKVEGSTWAGLLHWARGRAAAATGRLEGHDGQFPAALGKLPLHRMGRLALGTVLDGSEGVDLETDLSLLSKIGGEMATGLALSAHDIGHRMDKTRLDVSQGMVQIYGVSDEAREGLLSAISKARADISAWHAGKGEFPTASFDAVAAAEAKAAASSDAFKGLMPQKGATADELLNDLRRGAVISYRADHGTVQAIALSREGNAIKDLGSSREIFALAAKFRQAMAASAIDTKSKTDHSSGHLLRTRLIDPFVAELTGVGRYVIVGPPAFTAYPFTTLPEQAEGLRWLADIRQMAVTATVADLHRTLREVTPETFKLDYLAFGGDEAAPSETELTNFETPNELKVCGRYFQSGFNEILVGADAKLASWTDKASNARYIHISDLPPAMSGGFKMSDGVLSLDQVRNTPLHAEMVVITARTTPEQQQHRARAFLDAGARWVLVTNWEMDDRTRVRYLGNIYDSMNQERPPVRAMSEGRNRLFSDSLTGIDLDDPALWGGVTLFGKP